MTRSLFFSFFWRMAIALAFVALMRVWFTPRGWVIGSVLVVGWAAINAFLLTHSVLRSIMVLERSTTAIPERQVEVPRNQYSDFDGLARAIADA